MLCCSAGNSSSLWLCHQFPGPVEGFWLNRTHPPVFKGHAMTLVWEEWCLGESYLFAFLQQQLQSVVGPFGHHFIPLRLILTLGVVHVDAEVECYIHQGCHQLHGCQEHKCHWEIQSNPPTAIAKGLVYNKRVEKSDLLWEKKNPTTKNLEVFCLLFYFFVCRFQTRTI